MDLKRNLSENIKLIRGIKSQGEFAKQIGVGKSTIGKTVFLGPAGYTGDDGPKAEDFSWGPIVRSGDRVDQANPATTGLVHALVRGEEKADHGVAGGNRDTSE